MVNSSNKRKNRKKNLILIRWIQKMKNKNSMKMENVNILF